MVRKILCCFAFIVFTASQSLCADLESRLNSLEEVLKQQQKTIEEQQRIINQLKDELGSLKKQEAPTSEEKAIAPAAAQPEKVTQAEKPSGVSGLFGGSWMTNPYISLILNTNYFSTNIDERQLPNRGIPGYLNQGSDLHKGFNIEEAELFIFAPVDPYFNLYVNIPFQENSVSLEEAYFVTTSLPEGFQVKGGKFKSNFSRFNAQHPHAWDFADAPLPYVGFFGQEGLIEKGVQLTYLPKLPFYTVFGVEALQGENDVSFNSNATGGPHLWTGYAKASFDFGDYSTLLFGPYVLNGQTRTNTVSDFSFFSGNTTIYGFEAVYKWRPSTIRSFILQGEYLWRNQYGTFQDIAQERVSRLSRVQDGMYVQALYQLGRWRLGARYDRLNLFKEDYRLSGENQSFGLNPWRLTGALEFNPSEFSRIRLQYDYDRSSTNPRTAHEVYLQLILGIGAHAAHQF